MFHRLHKMKGVIKFVPLNFPQISLYTILSEPKCKIQIMETNEMKTAYYNLWREAYLKEGGKIWNEKLSFVSQGAGGKKKLNIVKKKKKEKQTLK